MWYPPVIDNDLQSQRLNILCCDYVALAGIGCDLIEVAAGATIGRHRTSSNSAKQASKGQIGPIPGLAGFDPPATPLCRS
jgi:hypothetical protein